MLQWHSKVKLQSDTNSRHTEINHVRTCLSTQIEADDAKKRGRLAPNNSTKLQTGAPNVASYVLYSIPHSAAEALDIKSYCYQTLSIDTNVPRRTSYDYKLLKRINHPVSYRLNIYCQFLLF